MLDVKYVLLKLENQVIIPIIRFLCEINYKMRAYFNNFNDPFSMSSKL